MRQHLRTHTREKSHRCTVCSAAFVWASQLKKHVAQSHKDTRESDATTEELDEDAQIVGRQGDSAKSGESTEVSEMEESDESIQSSMGHWWELRRPQPIKG